MQQLLVRAPTDTKATMAQQEMDGVFCKVRAEILKAGQFGSLGNGVLWDFGSSVIALARPRSNCTVNYRPVFLSERTH
jgi:hypothetical protein